MDTPHTETPKFVQKSSDDYNNTQLEDYSNQTFVQCNITEGTTKTHKFILPFPTWEENPWLGV